MCTSPSGSSVVEVSFTWIMRARSFGLTQVMCEVLVSFWSLIGINGRTLLIRFPDWVCLTGDDRLNDEHLSHTNIT